MPRQILILSAMMMVISCNQPKNQHFLKNEKEIAANSSNSNKDCANINELNKYREESINSDFKQNKIYNLNEVIKEDFNGDGIFDKAEFKKENEKAGIIITDGKSNKIFTIGLGHKFAHMDDFEWVDIWGIVKDTTTFEILFKDDEIIGDTIVKLEHTSIFVRKDEVGGGVITYKNDTYVWIHQTD